MARCKYQCVQVSVRMAGGRVVYDVVFAPVPNCGENAAFFADSAPRLALTGIKVDAFQVGQSYFLDFNPC